MYPYIHTYMHTYGTYIVQYGTVQTSTYSTWGKGEKTDTAVNPYTSTQPSLQKYLPSPIPALGIQSPALKITRVIKFKTELSLQGRRKGQRKKGTKKKKKKNPLIKDFSVLTNGERKKMEPRFASPQGKKWITVEPTENEGGFFL